MKFSEVQIAVVFNQAEGGTAVVEVCRKAGVSQATLYNWRKKYAGLMPSEMKWLHHLEDENNRLKKTVADLSLDKAKLREDRAEASHTNQVWAMDFVHDQPATGRKLRILTIIDTCPRFPPATDPRFSYCGENVVQTLERVCCDAGYPKTIRADNGSEFISRDLDLWAYANDVVLDFSRPGKPTDNAFIESFNGSFRAECLNTHWFIRKDGKLAQRLQ